MGGMSLFHHTKTTTRLQNLYHITSNHYLGCSTETEKEKKARTYFHNVFNEHPQGYRKPMH